MSFLKWCGGKKRLASKIMGKFPDKSEYDIYCEVFLGGGSIFFELKPETAILADINPNLINTFIIVKKYLKRLKTKLEEFDDEYNAEDMGVGKTEKRKKYYYNLRKAFNKNKYKNGNKLNSKKITERIVLAAYFIFLNKAGFNGMYRENKSGEMNIPIGSYKSPVIYNPEVLDSCNKLLQNKEIVCMDCFTLLDYVRNKYPNKRILYYLDPPYYVCDESKFNSYTEGEFTNEHQKQLAEYLINNNLEFVASNAECPKVRELYKDDDKTEIECVEISRTIKGDADRGKAKEVIIKNKSQKN